MIATAEKTGGGIDLSIEVSAPQNYILRSTENMNLFMAGAGSGKTHTMGLLSADFIINYPHMLGFIGANTHEQLNKSTLKRIFEVWAEYFKWQAGIHYVTDIIPPSYWPKRHVRLKEYHNTITFNNGCMLFVGSLDNYKAIDGQEFGWAMLDETKDTKEEALKETITWRLRQKGLWVSNFGMMHTSKVPGAQMKGYNPLFIFTSPAKEQWLNEMFHLDEHYDEIEKVIYSPGDFFRMKKNGVAVTISSTFHNEANLPDGFIQAKIQQYKGNKHLVATMIYGSPIAKIGSEFHHAFERSVHTGNFPYVPGAAFHISSDQNTNPYFTILVAQIFEREEKWVLRFIREYCLPNPRNNMESAAKTFLAEYEDRLHDGLFYYGDYSGKNQSSLTEQIKHHYEVLETVLKKYLNDSSSRVTPNKSIIKRRDFGNKVLAGGFNLTIEIDNSCTNLIADMIFLKEDRDGKKKKEMVTDRQTGISYQKYGHCSDAWDYVLTGAFPDFYEEFEQ